MKLEKMAFEQNFEENLKKVSNKVVKTFCEFYFVTYLLLFLTKIFNKTAERSKIMIIMATSEL